MVIHFNLAWIGLILLGKKPFWFAGQHPKRATAEA
jgi:hypothetical protein